MSKPIKLVLSGGLGNQLFQLSAAIYLKNRLNKNVIFDVSNLMGDLKSEPGNYTRKLEILELIKFQEIEAKSTHWIIDLAKTKFKKTFLKKSFLFESSNQDRLISRISEKTVGLYGFFQDSEFVESSWLELRYLFHNSDKFSSFADSKCEDQIAVHLRFGDYSDDPETKKTYGLTNKSYYETALKLISEKPLCPKKLIVVTDNVNRARNLITKNDFSGIIDYVSNANAIDDLKVIAKSAFVVMSNSTFSWWGAYIAFKMHDSFIVYPRPWMADSSDPDLPIYVKEWNSIPREYETV